jgi:hypothetical protein
MVAVSAIDCNALYLRCETVHARSDLLILKGLTACICSCEMRFDDPVCLHFFAVSCSPGAFFEHSYTSEQPPFNRFEFNTKKAASRPDAAVDKRPRRGRNDEVNAQLAEEEEGRARGDSPLCTKAQLPVRSERRPRNLGIARPCSGGPIALSALGARLVIYNTNATCALSAIGISRAKWRILRNLWLLPNMTIIGRSRVDE